MNSIDVIQKVCSDISKGKIDDAREVLKNNYAHGFIDLDKRNMSAYEKLKIFLKDGFIDRYSGEKLIFPNVLRILSEELGVDFPYHKNWKMSDCHIAYWDHFPTYDHIFPIARGGKDSVENIVTTSQKNNSLKSNYLLDEINWKIRDRGSLTEWDGLISWYIEYIDSNRAILDIIDKNQVWHRALLKCINEGLYR